MSKYWLHQRKDTKSKTWVVRWVNPLTNKKEQISTGTDDKLRAELFMEFFKKNNVLGDEIKVGEILDKYSHNLQKTQAPDNRKRTQSCVKMLKKYFNDSDPLNLKKELMQHKEERLMTIKESALARELSVLKSALNWAVSYDVQLINKRPYPVDASKKAKPRIRWLEDFEIDRLEEALKQEPLFVKLTFLLALTTAQRLGAILGLKTSQVKWSANIIDFNLPASQYKRKGRAICKIDNSISTLLKEAVLMSQSGFIIEENGKQVKDFYPHWSRVREFAKLDDFVFHDLRTTWGSNSAINGVPMVQIRDQLGHKSIKTTETFYAHIHKDNREEAQKFTEGFFKGRFNFGNESR